jgi:hypothetical protein
LRSVKEGERDDPAVKAAEEIMDGFIDDVCRLKVDTSVPFRVRGDSRFDHVVVEADDLIRRNRASRRIPTVYRLIRRTRATRPR